MIAIVATTALLVTGQDRSDDAPAAAGSGTIHCTVSTVGGVAATARREKQAIHVIRPRLDQLGGDLGDFVIEARGGSVTFSADGIGAAVAAQACDLTTTAIRPLVTRPVPLDTSGARSSDPFAKLGFGVPTGESAFARLSTARQARVRAAMSHYDCSGPAATRGPALLCDATSGRPVAYLFGTELVGSAGVQDSTAMGPSATGGLTEWTVAIQLTRQAGAKVQAFTTRHHTGNPSAEVSTCGPAPGRTIWSPRPCGPTSSSPA